MAESVSTDFGASFSFMIKPFLVFAFVAQMSPVAFANDVIRNNYVRVGIAERRYGGVPVFALESWQREVTDVF